MADITTKAKIKSYLGIATATTTYDTLFDTLAKEVTAIVERYCNRNFTEASYTEYFDVKSGDTKIFLRSFPIASLTSVQYRTGSWGSITWTDYNSNDYLLRDTNGKLTFASAFPDAEKFVKVVYTGGYKIDFTQEGTAAHTLPSDLTHIATEWCVKIFNMRKSAGILTESTEGQSITFKEENAGKNFKEALASYRNFTI